MTEDQEKVPLTNRQAALASLRRAQEKGAWPARVQKSTLEEKVPEERFLPTEKEYPTEEARREALAKITGKETIPHEIKEELTREARMINNLAMEQPEARAPGAPQQSEAGGNYKGPGMKAILKETAKLEEKHGASVPQEPVQPKAPIESTPPAPLPTAEQALRHQFRETPEVQQRKEPWLRRALNWLSPRKSEQAVPAQREPGGQAPEVEMTEEQRKWAGYSQSRRGNLGKSATSYRIRETKQMGPLPLKRQTS